MRRMGMKPADIDSVLDSTKLRKFVGKAVAEEIEALGEDMDDEEYATRVAELTVPAREQRSAAGACPRAPRTRPRMPPSPPQRPFCLTHPHTTPLSRALVHSLTHPPTRTHSLLDCRRGIARRLLRLPAQLLPQHAP